MTILGNEEILESGDRVWVWDPFMFGDKFYNGKVIGHTINFPKYMELLDIKQEVQYYVDFGDRKEWVASFQITGFLKLIN